MVYVSEGEISSDITSLSPVCRSGAFLYEATQSRRSEVGWSAIGSNPATFLVEYPVITR